MYNYYSKNITEKVSNTQITQVVSSSDLGAPRCIETGDEIKVRNAFLWGWTLSKITRFALWWQTGINNMRKYQDRELTMQRGHSHSPLGISGRGGLRQWMWYEDGQVSQHSSSPPSLHTLQNSMWSSSSSPAASSSSSSSSLASHWIPSFSWGTQIWCEGWSRSLKTAEASGCVMKLKLFWLTVLIRLSFFYFL